MMKGSPPFSNFAFPNRILPYRPWGENSGGASLGKELPAELRFLVRSQTVSYFFHLVVAIEKIEKENSTRKDDELCRSVTFM